MGKAESRFGFGQFAGIIGIGLVTAGLTQPWLRLDLPAAFGQASSGLGLPRESRAMILNTGLSQEIAVKRQDLPVVTDLGHQLGIAKTGIEQEQWIAVAIGVLLLIALIGVVRSVLAPTAWKARSNSPLLAVAGFGTLAGAGAALWLLAPEPHQAMRPDIGLYLMAGGAVCLLLGALTLGNNRRRPYLDDIQDPAPPRHFDGTDHLAYSHGAWVPRSSGDRERGRKARR